MFVLKMPCMLRLSCCSAQPTPAHNGVLRVRTFTTLSFSNRLLLLLQYEGPAPPDDELEPEEEEQGGQPAAAAVGLSKKSGGKGPQYAGECKCLFATAAAADCRQLPQHTVALLLLPAAHARA